MDKDLIELGQTNDDVIFILNTGQKIGWKGIKKQSIHRIIYLSKVLYSFVNEQEPNIMEYFHFSSNLAGPISSIIEKSLIDLESKEFIVLENSEIRLNIFDVGLEGILDTSINDAKRQKQEWFRSIILLLGKYGESKVFSFTINDPLYIENIESNSPKEIGFQNEENKTLEVLNKFKKAFENSLEDVSSIDKNEYLELYFDYIFSKIIK